MSETSLTHNELLRQKGDYSPFLVHLTKQTPVETANEILCDILDKEVLLAFHPWCIWYKDLEKEENAGLCQRFNVVCFTETPLDQIEILLRKVERRLYQPEPYGLVFEKTFIRAQGGNPVFYVTKEIAKPLSSLYAEQKSSVNDNMCRLLALTTICEDRNDWHWEREWRIVKQLGFELKDIYCALCPQDDILFFEGKYKGVTFIDPKWRMKEILDALVKRARKASITSDTDDLPF